MSITLIYAFTLAILLAESINEAGDLEPQAQVPKVATFILTIMVSSVSDTQWNRLIYMLWAETAKRESIDLELEALEVCASTSSR
jgi:hypothetical protein